MFWLPGCEKYLLFKGPENLVFQIKCVSYESFEKRPHLYVLFEEFHTGNTRQQSHKDQQIFILIGAQEYVTLNSSWFLSIH